MKTIQGIIFDVDGVLIDTEDVHFSAYKIVLKKYDFDLTLEGYKKWLSGKTIEGGVSLLMKDNNIKLDLPKIRKEKISSTKNIFHSQIKFYQDTLDFIYQITNGNKELKGLGKLSSGLVMALATGLEKTLIDEIFNKQPELKNIFKVVVTTEDYKHSKPNPECYLIAAEKMNIEPNNLIGIEDSPSGVTALNSANIFSIALTTTHAKDELKQANLIVDKLTTLVN